MRSRVLGWRSLVTVAIHVTIERGSSHRQGWGLLHAGPGQRPGIEPPGPKAGGGLPTTSLAASYSPAVVIRHRSRRAYGPTRGRGWPTHHGPGLENPCLRP